MGNLKDFTEKYGKGNFVRFTEGKPVVGVYLGSEMMVNPFDKTKETMEYKMEVDGKEQTFLSQSVRLAFQMDQMEIGEELELVRTGAGTATKWFVKKVNEAK